MYSFFFKRMIDFIFVVLGLTLISPIFIIITICLCFANKGKPFFVQLRPGKNEKIFKIFKFKTMNDKKDLFGNFLSDEERLTKIGKIVRKTSLDEIPQLFNVLIGDMSLIGPRPLLVEYLPLYNDFQKQRHNIRPGITGWAQVNGRNAISWKQKFEYDIWYVKNVSFYLDIKIFFKTFYKVIKRQDINTAGVATTTRFDGEN